MLIKEGKTNTKYLLIVVILAAIVGGGVLWYATKQKNQFPPLPEIKISKDKTADWKTYRNKKYEYEVKYPNDWKIAQSISAWWTQTERDMTLPDTPPLEDTSRWSGSTMDDWVVITSLSEKEYLDSLKNYRKTGSGFIFPCVSNTAGKTIIIKPSTNKIEELKENKIPGWQFTNFEEIELKTGVKAIRMKGYLYGKPHGAEIICEFEKGSISTEYEIVYIPYPEEKGIKTIRNSETVTYLVLLIERNQENYEKEIFDLMVSNFKFTKRNYSLVHFEKGINFFERESVEFKGENIEEYMIDTAKFEIIPKREEEWKGIKWIEKSYIAYNKDEKIFDPEEDDFWCHSPEVELSAFEYKNNKYIFLSCGNPAEHCCFVQDIFILDKNNELKFLKRLFTNNAKLNLVEKNDKLYIQIVDLVFEQFYSSNSPGILTPVINYLAIEDDNIAPQNIDFEEEYIAKAIDAEIRVEELYQTFKIMGKEKLKELGCAYYEQWFPEYGWSPTLLQRTVNYILIGEENKAWQYFDETFDKFSAISEALITDCYKRIVKPELLKEGIKENIELHLH
jgi:hypothetical protein